MIHYFESLPSTNQYCELLDLSQVEEFACYCAYTQTHGIGQRGNHWEAEPRQNLTFTLVLHPEFLSVSHQFALTQVLSLGVAEWLQRQLPSHKVYIKWPNDIYVEDNKICGILVSLRVQQEKIVSALCGIGLNLNQEQFSDWIPNPVSLKQLTSIQYSIESSLEEILASIQERYDQLRDGASLKEAYLSKLYRMQQMANYQYQERQIQATIQGVDKYGRLVLEYPDGTPLVCDLKEIKFL